MDPMGYNYNYFLPLAPMARHRHHSRYVTLSAPFGTRAPNFSYFPGLFKKSTNSTTSAYECREFRGH